MSVHQEINALPQRTHHGGLATLGFLLSILRWPIWPILAVSVVLWLAIIAAVLTVVRWGLGLGIIR